MEYTNAEKWINDLYTVVNGKNCNELRQWNSLLIDTGYN